MSLQSGVLTLTNKEEVQVDGFCKDGEKSDGATFGQSLINFMTLATGSVKTALQKPANYKKNINHRRYLQKQLKICTRRKKRSTKAKTGPKTKKVAKKQTALGTASEVWFGHTKGGEIFMASEGNSNQYFSTSNYQFYPSEAPCNGLENGYSFENSLINNTNFQNGFAWNNFTHSGHEQNNFFPAHQMDNTGTLFKDDILGDVIDESGEQFLSGEELTRVLDIKDLFVPERMLESGNNNDSFKSCTFDENSYNGLKFQTVPSTTSILSW